jgi:hypothetical protein
MYDASSTTMKDVVSVKNSNGFTDINQVTVSFYRDKTLETIEKNHENDTPRAYSKLTHGIAVIE